MSTLNSTYIDTTYDTLRDVRERTGGPRGPRKPTAQSRDFYERFAGPSVGGSHMPLDTDMHWSWSNPLNIIPAAILLVMIIAAVALLVGA